MCEKLGIMSGFFPAQSTMLIKSLGLLTFCLVKRVQVILGFAPYSVTTAEATRS